jgi:ribosomal protein S18 acetylase RimI-like enzyme
VDDMTVLYEQGTAWIRALGFDPGEAPRPMREIVADRIATGMLYVARLGDEAVATMTILPRDVEVWGEMPDDALYLHGFGVKRSYAGQGIGVALMDWLAALAAGQDRAYVRLDCEAGNRRLRDYYERAGFRYRGDVTIRSYTGSRYERSAAPRGTGDQTV